MRASTAAVRSTRTFAAGAKSVLGWIDGCNSAADEKSSMALSSVFIAGMGLGSMRPARRSSWPGNTDLRGKSSFVGGNPSKPALQLHYLARDPVGMLTLFVRDSIF